MHADERYPIADAYRALRGQALGWADEQARAGFDGIVGVLMETGHAGAVVTLLALTDGTVSLYFSSGGGIIGAGGQAPIAAAAHAFVAEAERSGRHLTPTAEFPLPAFGRTRFTLLTTAGSRAYEADEQALGHHRDRLSPLFHAGHAVIAAIRAHAPGR